jgi:hypothetical protein
MDWPAHNVKTYKPFTYDGQHQNRVCDNKLWKVIDNFLSIIQDVKWVELMAKSANATTVVDKGQFAIILEIPEELSGAAYPIDPSIDISKIRAEFIRNIRSHLANNRAVLVRQWYPGMQGSFSVEDIGMICPFMKQEVRWQGT